MIDVTLNEIETNLDLPDIIEPIELDGSPTDLDLQGPADFDNIELEVLEWGMLDLDLLGFPYYGLSAYEIALKHGFIGSEIDWLASLKGEDGDLSADGQAGVEAAQAAATNALGSATAASGYRDDAYAYSGQAGLYATASQDAYTQASIKRDEAEQFALATTIIHQQSEAILTDNEAVATAVIQQRVLAETARATAEAARNQAVTARTGAQSSAASASDSATMAVEARNAADDLAAAAVLSESNASTYADNALTEANAAQNAQIIASAARDEANITAAAVVIDASNAHASATDAAAEAAAAHTERLAAEVARGGADASAASAVVAKDQAVSAKNDATSAAATATDKSVIAVNAATAAGLSASAAATSESNAAAYADDSGALYSAIATRMDTTEATVGDLEADTAIIASSIADAQAKLAEARLVLTAAASGGTPARIGLYSDNYGLSAVVLDASEIWFGSDTYFDNATNTLQTTTGATKTVLALGADFGTNLRQWSGPTGIALGSMTRANAYFFIASTFPFVGGNITLNDGTVTTPIIADRNVTDSVSAYTDGSVDLGTAGTSTDVQTVVKVTSGKKLWVTVNLEVDLWHPAGGGASLYLNLYRNGVPVLHRQIPFTGGDYLGGTLHYEFEDQPTAGTYTYTLNALLTVTNASSRLVSARAIRIVENKTES